MSVSECYQSLMAHQHQKSYRAKTGDNDCNFNSSHYSLNTALCESIRYQAKSEQKQDEVAGWGNTWARRNKQHQWENTLNIKKTQDWRWRSESTSKKRVIHGKGRSQRTITGITPTRGKQGQWIRPPSYIWQHPRVTSPGCQSGTRCDGLISTAPPPPPPPPPRGRPVIAKARYELPISNLRCDKTSCYVKVQSNIFPWVISYRTPTKSCIWGGHFKNLQIIFQTNSAVKKVEAV